MPVCTDMFGPPLLVDGFLVQGTRSADGKEAGTRGHRAGGRCRGRRRPCRTLGNRMGTTLDGKARSRSADDSLLFGGGVQGR
jgi:hypothetical protein